MTILRTVAIAFVIVLSASTFSAFEQQVQNPRLALDIRQIMTVSEFKAAGFDKLSPEEMQALNSWLTRFALRLLSGESPNAAAPAATPGRGPIGCQTAIETQMEGTFNGWDGETLFKLTNGQIWQQSSYAYTYHYAYRPEVTIYPVSGGCKMKVKDVEQTISVKRIK